MQTLFLTVVLAAPPENMLPPQFMSLEASAAHIPELAALMDMAKRTGKDTYREFNEGGRGSQWFRATPDGRLARVAPPVAAPVTQPRREVAQPARATFRVPGDDHYCHRCGNETRLVEQSLPGGKHSHRCNACGYRWTH